MTTKIIAVIFAALVLYGIFTAHLGAAIAAGVAGLFLYKVASRFPY